MGVTFGCILPDEPGREEVPLLQAVATLLEFLFFLFSFGAPLRDGCVGGPKISPHAPSRPPSLFDSRAQFFSNEHLCTIDCGGSSVTDSGAAQKRE